MKEGAGFNLVWAVNSGLFAVAMATARVYGGREILGEDLAQLVIVQLPLLFVIAGVIGIPFRKSKAAVFGRKSWIYWAILLVMALQSAGGYRRMEAEQSSLFNTADVVAGFDFDAELNAITQHLKPSPPVVSSYTRSYSEPKREAAPPPPPKPTTKKLSADDLQYLDCTISLKTIAKSQSMELRRFEAVVANKGWSKIHSIEIEVVGFDFFDNRVACGLSEMFPKNPCPPGSTVRFVARKRIRDNKKVAYYRSTIVGATYTPWD